MAKRTRSLAAVDKSLASLARGEIFEEVPDLRSKADLGRVRANASEGLVAQNHATKLKLPVKRKAGKLLATAKFRGSSRKSNGHIGYFTLDDRVIEQPRSKRWQEAALPEPDFERRVQQVSRSGDEVTAAGLLQPSSHATRVGHRRERVPLGMNVRRSGHLARFVRTMRPLPRLASNGTG